MIVKGHYFSQENTFQKFREGVKAFYDAVILVYIFFIFFNMLLFYSI